MAGATARQDKARETRARILAAAQAAFSERGYSQAGLRDIAALAGVSSSLLVKYFSTKPKLFGEALKRALEERRDLSFERGRFAEAMVATVLDPDDKIVAPAMIALALGDKDARATAAEVVRDHIIAPVAAWLGPPDAEARAADMLMLSMGLVIFGRYMRLETMATPDTGSARWLARTLQDLIDRSAES